MHFCVVFHFFFAFIQYKALKRHMEYMHWTMYCYTYIKLKACNRTTTEYHNQMELRRLTGLFSTAWMYTYIIWKYNFITKWKQQWNSLKCEISAVLFAGCIHWEKIHIIIVIKKRKNAVKYELCNNTIHARCAFNLPNRAFLLNSVIQSLNDIL